MGGPRRLDGAQPSLRKDPVPCHCARVSDVVEQILSHASPFAVIPDEIKEKVKAYGKGVLSAWTPQQLILDHPVSIVKCT